VVSNLDPVRTALELVGAHELDAQFVHHLRHLRMNGCAAKVHLALDGLPTGWDHMTGRVLLAPGIDYVEKAYDCAKYGRVADHPALEMTIPSRSDSSLAPPGKHVVSIIAQYVPYRLRATEPDEARRQVEQRVIGALGLHAPDLKSRIVACEAMIPHDIEARFGATGGQWHHGEITLDQVFMLRPAPGFQQYRMPVPGVYLCGAGAHPGGNVAGQAGANAAREILRDVRKERTGS
jgi:phytoene dehydrogenase-like protein